ncbi:hypothetical protein DQ04_10331000 [Trypanosoma grayi]|uniref:hypothetical protein n=1 Tax=Trypanosoma grayi TaxID=71804 RepID=UPI0004F40AF7|nr:hypothetical protein DQ04_10331000 [Trypanosoma grayi]KEG07275.1 hypothetical protein DQ04_10331000 [Trypanosoma grayi]
MYTAHERATEVSSWLIIATRRDTRKIGVPSSLAPLLTEELPVEHPDYLQQQVLRTVSVGSDAVCAAQKIQCDAAVKDKKWRAHQNFREKALETAPVQELVIRNYKATFDHCTEEGQVHLKNLEEFAEAIYERMRLILMAHFPPCMDGHPTFFQRQNVNKFAARKLQLFQERLQAFLLSCVDHALAKKSITNRLDLYVITPPSRNAFVLHGAEPAAVTALIGAFTSGLMTKEPQKYRVAFHTTRSPLLTEEPTELREIICHIILQLCPDEEVYQQAIKEVDMKCLQKLFAEVLTEKTKPPETFTGSKGNRSENSITVVVLDGLDCVLPPVTPCAALRVSEETGKDVWDAPVSPLLPRKQQYQEEDPFAYIPHCLSRNVRLVLGCETDSDLHHRLESRGRDSVELLPMGPMTPNDFDEMLRPTVMSKFGVTLSDDDFVLIRKKEEALSPEYITLVVDALRSFNEAPGVETQAVIASLPGTVKEMVQQVYSNLRKCFGFPHIRKCSWLLMCSRWGIYEPQLRAMLQLPQQRFNQLMRMMRPLLEHSTPSILGIEGGNALHVRVCIRSRAFRELLEREDLRNEESENDHKVWHDMLVHCYLNVVHEVIGREQTPPIFGLLSTSPYERMAVKELLYHAVQADTRHIVHRLVLSMPYLMLVYRNGLGYHLVRDLIAAFNAFFVLYELGEYADDNEAERGEMPTSLSRLRDYIYFLRQNNARLMEFPHLVLQVAIESAARFRFVGGDAREYVARCMSHHAPVAQRRVVFFEVIDNARSTIHHGAVTACVFAPRAKRIITGSADRSVCSVNPATGAVAVQARQAPTRVEVIVYCETGAYHAAVCHDRTLLIYDSAQMRLVSRCDGGVFGAPLASVVFSARGRFYIVATEDLHVRVFETERSLEMLHVDQRQFLSNSGGVSEVNLLRGYAAVVPHRVEDEVFYVTCHNVVNMWKLTPTRDEFLHEMSFELPFTVDSGKAVMSGTHLLLHPAPLPVPADGHRPAPRLMRICSIAERREVAVLTSPCSQLLYQFSVDEKLVACALDDGSLTVYRVPWACLQDGQVNLMSIVPFVHFSAFCESPVPTVQALRFRGNSAGLFALGNSTMMKYWALPRKMGRTSGGDSVDSEEQQEADEWDVAEEEQEDEILVGVADGEFVLAADEATAWDVTQASPTREAEIVFGDASGRLTMLRMWSPLM